MDLRQRSNQSGSPLQPAIMIGSDQGDKINTLASGALLQPSDLCLSAFKKVMLERTKGVQSLAKGANRKNYCRVAKVGVEGSNPLALSKFVVENQGTCKPKSGMHFAYKTRIQAHVSEL